MIYLDHNATTAIKPVAVAAVTAALSQTGNPSSVHTAGRAARGILENARRQVATLAGTEPKQVIFTSGATEANNTVLKSFKGRILTSSIEHPSVIESTLDTERIPVTHDGLIDLSAFENLLSKDPAPALVSVMMVNNETGVIQPIEKIAALAKAKGARVHTDAVQAAGRVPIDFKKLNVDYMTLSAHKMGGPMGAGALIVAPGAPPVKIIHGGGQERRQRAGTENIAAIAGFGASAESAIKDMDQYQRLAALRDRIEQLKGITIYGAKSPRVANTTCFSLNVVSADTQLMALDLGGICVSSGSACSSGSVKPSHVLAAMNVAPGDAGCALRVSLGWNTTDADVNTFIDVWTKLARDWTKGAA